jgi:hypothetical protein
VDPTTGLSATSAPIQVTPAGATHFAIASVLKGTVGVAVYFSVVALDPYNNVATGYSGPVNLYCSDPTATLPPVGTVVSGIGTFSCIAYKAEQIVLEAYDIPDHILGFSPGITIASA